LAEPINEEACIGYNDNVGKKKSPIVIRGAQTGTRWNYDFAYSFLHPKQTTYAHGRFLAIQPALIE